MDLSLQSLILLPVGLGLLGFVEPCTIGGHLIFLDTQKNRSSGEKTRAVAVFIIVRSIVAGLFGAFIAFLGHKMISMQTGLWLVFGLIYIALGLVFLTGRAGWMKHQANLAPAAWKRARNPLVLGLAFGLNIPACAAPILFALLSLAATTGTIATGFLMMFLFGLFLSLPLALFAFIPSLANRLDSLANWLGRVHWLIGLIFVALGIWSLWFGLYIDPAKWAGQ